MVCIPCLLLPLAGLFVFLFDFIKPFLQKMGILHAPKIEQTKNQTQEISETPTNSEPQTVKQKES